MDAIEPSEYSYFKPAVVASWAGPQHWKIGTRNVEKKGIQDMLFHDESAHKSNFWLQYCV